MMDLCARYRGVQQEYKLLDGSDRAILKYKLPLAGQSALLPWLHKLIKQRSLLISSLS
jgi:translation elongation factor EF-4